MERPPKDTRHVENISFKRLLFDDAISAKPLVISTNPLEIPLANELSIFIKLNNFSKLFEIKPSAIFYHIDHICIH